MLLNNAFQAGARRWALANRVQVQSPATASRGALPGVNAKQGVRHQVGHAAQELRRLATVRQEEPHGSRISLPVASWPEGKNKDLTYILPQFDNRVHGPFYVG